MTEKNQPIGGNELARFSGPGTFMRLPAVNDLKGLDVAVLGIPMDIGTSWRSGTRFGPKQIRAESAMLRPYNLATGAAPFDSLQVADIGDLAINTFSLSDSLSIIKESYNQILMSDAMPIAMGGIIQLPCLSYGRWPNDTGLSRWCMLMRMQTSTTICLVKKKPTARCFAAPMKKG